jgi:uncharacterized glyoxalase superfamily protein PhnB
MEFRWTILYVSDVKASVSFYEAAFGLTRRMITEEGGYAEMETGSTRLAFAAVEFAKSHLPAGVLPHSPSGAPQAVELAFVTDDVEAGFRRAVRAGATPVYEPKQMPWGQTVSWVRDPEGVLIEVASDI